MGGDDRIILTDDEVVAVAIVGGSTWPSALPTVDVADSAALRAAAFRGRRSLAARRLGADGELTVAPTDEVGEALAAGRRALTAFLATSDGRRAGWGVAVTTIPAGDHWLVDNTSPIGLHQLTWLSEGDHLQLIKGFLAAALRHGPGAAADGDSPDMLCVTSAAPGGGLLACARAGSLTVVTAEIRDGFVATTGEAIEASPEGAAAQLVASTQTD